MDIAIGHRQPIGNLVPRLPSIVLFRLVISANIEQKFFRIRSAYNNNTQFIKTVYFESNLIQLQQLFARYVVIKAALQSRVFHTHGKV